jgi:small subunit ribosomal protein S1
LGGIKAFLPGSQIDLKPIKSLDKLIGKKFPFKILKLSQEKGNIVLSRRALLEQERETLKKDILENIKEGQIIHGTVKNITDYGAFVDLGGIDGLLHITDMTWGRINHPTEVLKVNDEIDVVVLKYDAEKEKVSLGYKQLQEDPWEKSASQFKSGEKIKGKVVSLADYGAFIEVFPGIEGLVHVSELSWSKKIKHPNKLLKVGDVVDVLILDVDKENRKMALGLKQLEPNPWDILHQKYPLGSRVVGKVRNITDFGIFVGVDEEEIDGLVHVSDISWDKNYKWPNEDYKKGQDVEVVVINIDRDNKKFSLGIKQLSDNPFAIMMRTFPLGVEVTGKIEEVDEKGNFSATVEAESKIIVFKESDLLKLLGESAKQVLGADFEVKNYELKYLSGQPDFENGKLQFVIDYKGIFWRPIDVESFKNSILKKKENELKMAIFSLAGVDKATVSFWPFWVKAVPENIKKIKTEIE